jgi:hypothetical protein
MNTTDFRFLTEAEKMVIYRMRCLRPFEKIEIRLDDNRRGKLAVVFSSTCKEIFNDL